MRNDDRKRGKKTQSSSLAPRPQTLNDGRRFSKGSAPRGSTPSGRERQKAYRHYLRGNCTTPSCGYWHPPECQNYKTESGCKVGDKCLFRHAEGDSQPSQKPKKSGGKCSVAILKNSKQFGCVFHNVEAPKSKSILRKCTKFLGPKRSVHFSKRYTTPRVECGKECVHRKELFSIPNLMSAAPMLQKFEDRTQEETLQQEACSPVAEWPVAKNHMEPQMAETFNANTETLYRSLAQDYRQVLPARVNVWATSM